MNAPLKLDKALQDCENEGADERSTLARYCGAQPLEHGQHQIVDGLEIARNIDHALGT